MTTPQIEQAAQSIAANMIEVARMSGTEPVVFVTGNRFMPPLRSYAEAEAIWRDDEDGEAFEILDELIEGLLNAAHVYLGCPDYDNALYVVDLARFEYNEDAEGDTLSSEWRVRSPERDALPTQAEWNEQR